MEPKAAAIVRPHQTLQKKEEDLIYTLNNIQKDYIEPQEKST